MLQAIELETVIPADGKLPEAFRQFFGRKARVIVLAPDPVDERVQEEHEPPTLIELAGRIDVFKAIEDPVAWQRTVRDEWTREWDQ